MSGSFTSTKSMSAPVIGVLGLIGACRNRLHLKVS